MSLLSSLNNVTKSIVRIVAGAETASVYGTVAASLGAATLETVVVAGQVTTGIAVTTAAAVPAVSNFTKGAGLGLLQAANADQFVSEWASMSKEERDDAIKALGIKAIAGALRALREEEAK